MATLVVAAGRAIVTNRLKNGSTGTTEPNYVAWGTGAGTTADTDTTLFTESSEARVAGTSTRTTTTTTNDTYQVDGTMTASGGARAITNAGLFDAVTVGNLFLKGDFAVVNLADTEQIAFTFKAKFA